MTKSFKRIQSLTLGLIGSQLIGYGLAGEHNNIHFWSTEFLSLPIRYYASFFGLPHLHRFPNSSTHCSIIRRLASWEKDFYAKEASFFLLGNLYCHLRLGVVPRVHCAVSIRIKTIERLGLLS